MDREDIDEDPQFKLMGRKGLQRILPPASSAEGVSQPEKQVGRMESPSATSEAWSGKVPFPSTNTGEAAPKSQGLKPSPPPPPIVVDLQQAKQPKLSTEVADVAYLNRVVHSLETLRSSVINERRPPPLREKGLR